MLLHYKFTAVAHPGKVNFLSHRKLDEVFNTKRRNAKTTIINHRRKIFKSWKDTNKKEHQSEAFQLVKCVTLEAQVHKHNHKERDEKSEWSTKPQTSAGRVPAY